MLEIKKLDVRSYSETGYDIRNLWTALARHPRGESQISTEIFRNSSLENENSPANYLQFLRKNQMKLRKNQMKLRKKRKCFYKRLVYRAMRVL